MLRGWTHHESRNILHEQQRRLMTIAGFDEVSDLLSRFGVDDTAKSRRATAGRFHHSSMISNDTDLYSANAGVPGDDFLRIVRLELVQMSFVENTVQQVAHVVGLAMIFG